MKKTLSLVLVLLVGSSLMATPNLAGKWAGSGTVLEGNNTKQDCKTLWYEITMTKNQFVLANGLWACTDVSAEVPAPSKSTMTIEGNDLTINGKKVGTLSADGVDFKLDGSEHGIGYEEHYRFTLSNDRKSLNFHEDADWGGAEYHLDGMMLRGNPQ